MAFAHKMRVMGTLRRHQNGRCAYCDTPTHTMVLDHDHDTDLVRGLLCSTCNSKEGRTPPGADDKWDAYRANPPARAAGVEVDYWSL